jgi:phage gp29-like protein
VLATLLNSGVGAFTTGTEIKVLEASGTGQSFDVIDKRINARIQKLILGQTLTSEQGGRGSQALGTVHKEVLQELINGDLKMLEPAFQRVTENLVSLSFPELVGVEVSFSYDKDKVSHAALSTRDKALFDVGVRFNKSYFESTYNLKPDNFEVNTNTSPSLPLSLGLEGGGTAKKRRFTNHQQTLEDITAQALELAGSVNNKGLLDVFKKAKNRDDLKAALLSYFEGGKNKASDDFVRTFETLLFAADVLGFEAAEKGVS